VASADLTPEVYIIQGGEYVYLLGVGDLSETSLAGSKSFGWMQRANVVAEGSTVTV
jgi:hypothetical protein